VENGDGGQGLRGEGVWMRWRDEAVREGGGYGMMGGLERFWGWGMGLSEGD
jgi:hypothetical protein